MWQTIRTAPKDGTPILATVRGSHYGTIYIIEWVRPELHTTSGIEYGTPRWEMSGRGVLCEIPTHWMPLPEPPK